MASYALAGAIAGLAGFSAGQLLLAFFANGAMLNFYGFVPVALGGLGNNRGAVVGRAGARTVSNRPPISPSAAFSPAWRYSACSSWCCWRRRRASSATRPPGVSDAAPTRRPAVSDAAMIASSPARVGVGLRGALPYLAVLAAALGLLVFQQDYWTVIATRAAIYWVLVAGLNLVVGFAGQLAIGYVALLTLGAYAASVLVEKAGVPPFHRHGRGGADRRGGRGRRRAAGATAAHVLFRDGHAGVRDDRHSDRAGLDQRHRRGASACPARRCRHRSTRRTNSTCYAWPSAPSAPG